jgi:hypothetical protein
MSGRMIDGFCQIDFKHCSFHFMNDEGHSLLSTGFPSTMNSVPLIWQLCTSSSVKSVNSEQWTPNPNAWSIMLGEGQINTLCWQELESTDIWAKLWVCC